ncbi:MAG: hypothetical protein ABFS14_10070 [Gemmatimonadota bacterium]
MRVKRFSLGLGAICAFVLTACGGSELSVQVLSEGAEGAIPVSDIPVTFLPFDRDSLFAVLTAEAPSAEPTVPEDLTATFARISQLQETWRQAETEWAETRDQLQRLSAELQSLDRRSREYRERFDRFNDLEASARRLDREKQDAFNAFDSLQRTALARADSVRAVIAAWEDVAFARFGERETEILEALGAEIFEDTTNANGTVSRRLGSGRWWVHSRVTTASGERYWNVPVRPGAGDTLRLDASNGEDRLRF